MPQASTDELRKHKRIAYSVVATIAAVAVVISWGITFYVGRDDWTSIPLERRGTFGDSFGVVNSLFSGLALVGVILAFCLQREQLVEQRIEISDNRLKENKEAVETRFFQLLSSLQVAVNSTRVGQDGIGSVGRQAIRRISLTLTHEQRSNRKILNPIHPCTLDERRADIDQWFTKFYKGAFDSDGKELRVAWGDLLGHLFLLLFHILKYIDENTDIEQRDKISYVSILRAHLSNPELVLLFYNCLSRYGYGPHFELVQKYGMLKNLNIDALPDPADATLYRPVIKGKVP